MLQKFNMSTRAKKPNTMLAEMLMACVTRGVNIPTHYRARSWEFDLSTNQDWARAIGFLCPPNNFKDRHPYVFEALCIRAEGIRINFVPNIFGDPMYWMSLLQHRRLFEVDVGLRIRRHTGTTCACLRLCLYRYSDSPSVYDPRHDHEQCHATRYDNPRRNRYVTNT